jgi:excinuclease UvrABC ATPase subunit
MNDITIIGASQNNLKNINITIPKHLVTVFTGRSGSVNHHWFSEQ